jgi:hypothetical protein
MTTLMKYAEENGHPLSKDETKRAAYIAVGHCEMKQVFGSWQVVPKPTPKDTQGLEELMEEIRAWGAGFGCVILLPNEGITYPRWPQDSID